jgi:hypothetical protein
VEDNVTTPRPDWSSVLELASASAELYGEQNDHPHPSFSVGQPSAANAAALAGALSDAWCRIAALRERCPNERAFHGMSDAPRAVIVSPPLCRASLGDAARAWVPNRPMGHSTVLRWVELVLRSWPSTYPPLAGSKPRDYVLRERNLLAVRARQASVERHQACMSKLGISNGSMAETHVLSGVEFNASLDAHVLLFSEGRFAEQAASAWCHALLDGCVRFAHDPQLRLFNAVLHNEAPSNAHAEINDRFVRIFRGVRKATQERIEKGGASRSPMQARARLTGAAAKAAAAATSAAAAVAARLCSAVQLLSAIEDVCPSLKTSTLNRLSEMLRHGGPYRYGGLLRGMQRGELAIDDEAAAVADDPTGAVKAALDACAADAAGDDNNDAFGDDDELEPVLDEEERQRTGQPLPRAFTRLLRDALCAEPFEFVRTLDGMLTASVDGCGHVGSVAVATVATCRSALAQLDPQRSAAAVNDLIAATFLGGDDAGQGGIEVRHERRANAVSRIDEAEAKIVGVLTRRILLNWPRWSAPPDDDPSDLIARWSAAASGAPLLPGAPAQTPVGQEGGGGIFPSAANRSAMATSARQSQSLSRNRPLAA